MERHPPDGTESWLITYADLITNHFAQTVKYALGVAHADAPGGPFERYPDNPILETKVEAGIYGPGHHSVVQGAREDLLIFYHTKASEEVEWNRRIRYAPLFFDENGFVRVEQP